MSADLTDAVIADARMRLEEAELLPGHCSTCPKTIRDLLAVIAAQREELESARRGIDQLNAVRNAELGMWTSAAPQRTPVTPTGATRARAGLVAQLRAFVEKWRTFEPDEFRNYDCADDLEDFIKTPSFIAPCNCGLSQLLNALIGSLPQPLPKRDANYYAQAVGLVCDELEQLKPEKLDERRDKMIAILRHAALAFDDNEPARPQAPEEPQP